jgi:hypothetical protein
MEFQLFYPNGSVANLPAEQVFWWAGAMERQRPNLLKGREGRVIAAV